MTNNSPGWAIELIGEAFDIDSFKELLAPPFDPWMEEFLVDEHSIPILRSKNWEKLSESSDVVQDGERILSRLNGEILLIYNDAKPLKLGNIMRFDQLGEREQIIFLEPAIIKFTGGRVRLKLTRNTSTPTTDPQASNMQRWFDDAEHNDTLADLFVQLARIDSWYDLYKTMELVERLGKGLRKFHKIIDVQSSEKWKRIRRTANHYRHAPGSKQSPLPKNSVNFDEAKDFIMKTIPRVL